MNFKKFLIIFSLIILVSGCVGGGDSTTTSSDADFSPFGTTESEVSDFLAESIKDDFAKGRLESEYIGMSLDELTDDQLQQVQEAEFAQFLPYSPEWRAFADERGISYTTPSESETDDTTGSEEYIYLVQNDAPIVLGKIPTSGNFDVDYSRQFEGNMDELIIYDRALTSDEVETLYLLGEVPNPVFHVTFDSVYEICTHQEAGTPAILRCEEYYLSEMPTLDEGKSGSAIEFDKYMLEPNSIVTFHNDRYINAPILSSSSQSISLWIKPTSYYTEQNDNLIGVKGILFKAPDTGLSREIGLELDEGFIIYSVSDGNQLHKVKSSKRVTSELWTHIVIIKEQENGITKLTLYQDKLAKSLTLSQSELSF